MDRVKDDTQAQKILAAAYECLSSKGYANITLRDIADKAGVVLSQLSYYYKNKEGLFIEVVKEIERKYLKEVEIRLKENTDAKGKISSLIAYFKEMITKDPGLFKLLYDFSSLALWSAKIRTLFGEMFSDMTELIEKNILSASMLGNTLKLYPAKSVARMITGAMFGIAIQFVSDPGKAESLNAFDTIELIFA